MDETVADGVDLTGGIAARLASRCLDRRGRLRDFDLWDDAARGALLVDLVRAERLVHGDDSVTVDGTPTGFGPADRLLAAMVAEPGRSLDDWMAVGPVGMPDVAGALVDSGRWTVRRRLLTRRFADVSAASAADRARDPHRPDGTWTPETATVVVLGLACGAYGRPEPIVEAELAPTGPLRWVCEAVTTHLERAHRANLRSAGAADGGSVPYH
ncbi:GPP34 family phosphoprotein [Geodermatophilus sp. DSM 44513]|uniref:GPP34 family phosphoprotein n=1 Tax=Geodermatophilus sp. DSM 44513 TaxID=1528104 RepID=UPI0012749227|nr:GPP34 family phosphoprotein [Geodermatophilus sp. DSM 44513]WNV77498.1 GPP34 family phosphoprotein [Geodermatophilus sp. DSM 44513]